MQPETRSFSQLWL